MVSSFLSPFAYVRKPTYFGLTRQRPLAALPAINAKTGTKNPYSESAILLEIV